MKNHFFDLLTVEDVRKAIYEKGGIEQAHFILNKILSEKGEGGFCISHGDVEGLICSSIKNYQKCDTHHALVFLEAIEGKKADCKHQYGYFKQKFKKNVWGGIPELIEECPKCKKALK